MSAGGGGTLMGPGNKLCLGGDLLAREDFKGVSDKVARQNKTQFFVAMMNNTESSKGGMHYLLDLERVMSSWLN